MSQASIAQLTLPKISFVIGFGVAMVFGIQPSAPVSAGSCTQASTNGSSGVDSITDASGRQTTIYAHEGGDYVEARDCTDTIWGGQGADQLHGAYGDDNIHGQDGHDNTGQCGSVCGGLYGGAGDDYATGGNGGDSLLDNSAGSDIDNFYGEGADDNIRLNDGDPDDKVDAGLSDYDYCYIDNGDLYGGCDDGYIY